MKAFKCPKCGGDVKYDIAKASIQCDYCGETIKREEYQRFLDDNGLYATTRLTCPQCGGSVLSYDDTISTFCSYCGAPVVFDKRIVEDTKPSAIIPFSVTKKAAAKAYDAKIKKSYFAPDWLYDPEGRALAGIYMPYYVYRADADGGFYVKGERRTNIGSYTLVEEFNVDFDLEAHYDGTRFDAARAFPDALSESVDKYDLKKSSPFRTAFLAGFYADGGDVAESEYSQVVSKLVSNDIRGSGLTTYDGISLKTDNIDPNVSVSAEKTLFPVWLHTHRRKDKVCYSAINGQTAEVAAEIPIDKWKYIKVSVILAAVIAALLDLFFTFTPKTFLTISEIILICFGFQLRKLHGDVYLRKHRIDDIGFIGIDAFNNNANTEKQSKGGSKYAVGKSAWSFSIPNEVRIKGWRQTFAGVVLYAAVILSGTVLDPVYYTAAGASIALSIWSAFDIIKQHNLLSSRDIPVFTMKRGGDGNG